MPKVIAVIPTYNSAEIIAHRIKELQQSSFESIIVCDDNSTDNTTELLSDKFGQTIQLIVGEENLGPGGNRNRILSHNLTANSDFLFFLDVDCQVLFGHDLASAIAESFTAQDIGVVGYSISDREGKPMCWNYGDLMHPVHEAADQRLEEMFAQGLINREQFVAGALARAASLRLLPESGPKQVGWVAEGCFAIRTALFRKIGGFAAQMRYHETHDFNARVHEAGYKTIFNPLKLAKHLAYASRLHRRKEDERLGRLYYYQTHWGMSEGVFARLFDEV